MASRYDRLSMADQNHLLGEAEHTPFHVIAVLQLEPGPLLDGDGRLRLEQIRTRIGRRLARAPRLRQIVHPGGPLTGPPFWIDDRQFNVARHVHAGSVPAPGTEAELLDVVANLGRQRLDRSHPLWEIRLLTGLASGRVALVLKLHHVIADGLAAIQLMASLFDFDAEADDPPAAPGPLEAQPRRWDLMTDNIAGKAVGVARAIGALRRPAAVWRSAALAGRGAWDAFAFAGRAPRSSLNQPVGGERRLAVSRFPLDEIKAIAHAHGGKVNDVFLTLVTGGLRALLIDRGEPVGEGSLLVSVPVSLRHDNGLGNEVGMIIVSLPTGEPDAGAQLDRIVDATRRAKREQVPAVGTVLASLTARMGLFQAISRHQRFVNLFVTNVAGPPMPVYVLGARLLDVVPVTSLAGNCPLGFAALSYDGWLAVTIIADADHVPNLEAVRQGVRSGWAALTRPVRSAVPASFGQAPGLTANKSLRRNLDEHIRDRQEDRARSRN